MKTKNRASPRPSKARQTASVIPVGCGSGVVGGMGRLSQELDGDELVELEQLKILMAGGGDPDAGTILRDSFTARRTKSA